MSFTVATAAQRSPAWFALRCGRFTGSRARAVLARIPHGEALTRAGYRRQLATERYTGTVAPDGFVSAAMRRGFEQEPAAIAAYEAATGATVRRTGFLAHTTLLAGCSLDGDVEDFGGILEVKNPNTATHLSWLQAGRLPPAHVAQVTHNLWISGARFCDFVSYDDRCGAKWRLFVYRTAATDLDLAGYDRKAIAFLAEVDRELASVRALLEAPPAPRPRPVAFSHFIPYDAIGRSFGRAECGLTVSRLQHANAPTCPDCRQRLAEGDAMDFGQ